ncbi:MAG: pyridoxal phosphate-dependent aminotransferase [Acidobacteria bacterium]|nr:pyridoxal phosphate-dependent aminotransferase [Acidobacteriota bacterium]
MTWAKYHAGARYNLANSGIIGCELSDLTLSPADLMVNGPNHEGYGPLKEAIGSKYGVEAARVVTAQGTSMANFLAIASNIELGDEALIETPAYDPLLAAAIYCGATVRRFNRSMSSGYQIDPDEIAQQISPRTKLIVLTSPHNPSGEPVRPEILRQIGELAARAGARVLVDEVYRDILFEDAPLSAAHLGDQFIATNSLTKSYGLSGLRCGWILCAPQLAERIRRLNDLFGAVGSMPADRLAVFHPDAFGAVDEHAQHTPDRHFGVDHLIPHADDRRLDGGLPRTQQTVSRESVDRDAVCAAPQLDGHVAQLRHVVGQAGKRIYVP